MGDMWRKMTDEVSPQAVSPFLRLWIKWPKRTLGILSNDGLSTCDPVSISQEKEYYGQLTEVENEKRRREHIFELRDRAIAEWEEDEARRRGVLGSSVLDATTEHTRGLLLAVSGCCFASGDSDLLWRACRLIRSVVVLRSCFFVAVELHE